jgi:uncharacterized protein (TIGR03066 family)
MRAILLGTAAAVLVVAGGGSVVGRDAKDKVDAKLLVGKWTLDDKEKRDRLFLEFKKDGKLVMSLDFGGGKEFKLDGTYKVDGNKITSKINFMGQEKSETHTIDSLTATKLVTTDEKGMKDVFVRASGKGGDK